MPDKSAASVKAVFDRLEKKLGTFVFCSLFQTIITDRGTEFSDPDALETGIDNIIRTSIYYCDPMCAWQKPGVERATNTFDTSFQKAALSIILLSGMLTGS